MSQENKTKKGPWRGRGGQGRYHRGGRRGGNTRRDDFQQVVEFGSSSSFRDDDTDNAQLLGPLNVTTNLERTQINRLRMGSPQQHSHAIGAEDFPPPYSECVRTYAKVASGDYERLHFSQKPTSYGYNGEYEGQPKVGRWRGGKSQHNQDTRLSMFQGYEGTGDQDGASSLQQGKLRRPQVVAGFNEIRKEEFNEERSIPKTMQNLEVSIEISKCFKDEAEVKRIVQSTIEKAQNEFFRIQFLQIVLMHKTLQTRCDFIISSLNRLKARRLVQISIAEMETKIGAGIALRMQNQYSENFKETGVDKNEGRKKVQPHNDAPVSKTLYVTIEKSFEPANLLVEFIKSCLEDATFNFHVVENSITQSDSATSCLMCTDSKADARRLKKALLNASSTEQVKIICHEYSFAKRQQKAKANDIKSQISEAISSANEVKEKTLMQHMEKIKNYEDVLMSDCDDEDPENDGVFLAIRNRIARLKYQKSTFIGMCNSLYQNFQMEDPRTVNSNAISSFLESVGRECNRLLFSHPVYSWRKVILDYLKQDQVCIVSGNPGSGKSTQVVQYLYEAGYSKQGVIVCCQSCTSAVVGISEKVARELVGKVGDVVGYKTETVSKADDSKTKILFTPESFLLNECLNDPNLKRYSCIILDDAQEGRINTNVLMGIIKTCLRKRNDLRVVILESQGGHHRPFANFFSVDKEIRVSGRNFPMQIIHEEVSDNFENYEKKAFAKAVEIHTRKNNTGDILIFLCSPLEIMRCCSEFEKTFHGYTDFKCIPLHDYLPLGEMKRISEKLPKGVRKVIFASACAESQIPLQNVKYVIDSGVTTEKDFDSKRNLRVSGIRTISKSSAIQRKNLLGSCTYGTCYRLYSEDEFDSLPVKDTPEIQRANLGHIVSKLIHMGIDIHSFDFPIAPKREDLIAAVRMLVDFGAVVDYKITDLGKWISRMPLDPANSYLVYKSAELNKTYDAVVLATLLFHSCDLGLFYFPLSNKESENVTECRRQLLSPFGDVFTSLSIFKEWSRLAKAERTEWCHQHGINYKALGFIGHYVDDILTILKNDMNIHVTKTFSQGEGDMEKLRKILFGINIASVCQSSDKQNDIFCSMMTHHIFASDPESSLFLNASHPEYIVFTDLLKTSREYIKGVIAAKEEWIQEAIDTKIIKVEPTEIQEKLVYSENFSPEAFRLIVRPLFRGLWKLGERIRDTTGSTFTLEADENSGILKIYSSYPLNTRIAQDLNNQKSSTNEQVCLETFEFALSDATASEMSDLKLRFGQGGLLHEYNMSTQRNQLHIWNLLQEKSFDDILSRCETFGQVTHFEEIHECPETVRVTFRSIYEALIAFQTIKTTGFPYIHGLPWPAEDECETRDDSSNALLVKLSWCQTPLEDNSRAFIECSPLDRLILKGSSVEILGKACEISISPDNANILTVLDIGSASAKDITEKLKEKLLEVRGSVTDLNVSVVKNASHQIESDNRERVRGVLDSLLQKHIQKTEYLLYSPLPIKSQSTCVCYVRFYDPLQGEKICQEMNQSYEIDGQKVEFSPSYSAVLRVSKIVKDMCQEQLSNTIDSLVKTYERLNIEWKPLREDYAIEIECSKHEPVQKASECLSRELRGEIVDCSTNVNWECLLNEWGQNRLETIQDVTDCVFATDLRNDKVHVYGSKSNVKHAIEEINSYLSDNLQAKHFSLQFPGMMISMIRKYGPTLDGLIKDCCLHLAKLDIPNKSLRVVGSPSTIEDAAYRLQSIEDALKMEEMMQENVTFPVCVMCRCVTAKGSFHRLEMCNHSYCFDCLSSLANGVIKNFALPLVCMVHKCNKELAARDVRFILNENMTSKRDYFVSVLHHANRVGLNFSSHWCPTLNCPMSYKISYLSMGAEFVCPLCLASVCTTCHRPFHRGMSCHVAKEETQSQKPLPPTHFSSQLLNRLAFGEKALYSFELGEPQRDAA